MLDFIVFMLFLPFIVIAMIMASPFILILGVVLIVVMTILWIGQMAAIIIAVLFVIGWTAKYIENKEASK